MESDQALIDITNDALGVGQLASGLAKSIHNLNADDGFVIGVYGEWGIGKTTFINFVKQELTKLSEETLILNFNPWIFSGKEDLVQRFIVELSAKLSPKKDKVTKTRKWFWQKTEETSDIADNLLSFAGSLTSSSILTSAALFSNPALAAGLKVIGKLSKRAISELSKEKPLSEQKDIIKKQLRDSNKKIVVIIDDIDRLSSDEMLSIFRMVKSVADFPNIIYILSFDKSLVTNVVSEIQKSDGANYLEKIIQYDVSLPYPDHSNILKLFGQNADILIDDKRSVKFDKNRWSEIYRDYLVHYLNTPRRAIRLSNAFCMIYTGLMGEVNPVDLISIEALRAFSPEIYDVIRKNASKFIELGQNEFNSKETDPVYYEDILSIIPDTQKEHVTSILKHLFPRVEAALDRYTLDTGRVSEWQAESRVCSGHHFSKYFRYGLYDKSFSNEELMAAIKSSNDVTIFRELLIDYSKEILGEGQSRIPEFLEKTLDYIKIGKADAYLSNIVEALLVEGDNIIRKDDTDRQLWFRIETNLRITWILLSALERMDGQDVYPLLERSFENSNSVYMATDFLMTLSREHGRYSSDKPAESIRHGKEPYTTSKQFKKLEEIVESKIQKAADDKSLLDADNMLFILYRWMNISGSYDKPRKWSEEVTQNDDDLIKFIRKGVRITVVHDGKGSREEKCFDYKDIKNFIDIEKVQGRIRNILDNNLISDEEKQILNLAKQE